MEHEVFMNRCLELASNGIRTTSPNPMVGSVIVYKGAIIGEGWHQRPGDPHAEVRAIRSVKDQETLRDSTLYVNLEPCSHHGRTPPCADLIVQMGIPRVVIAMTDPHKKVAGKGIQRLRDHGVEVVTGILEEEAKWLNRRFITFHTEKRPYVILKWAQTQEGFMDKNRTDGEKGQFSISHPRTRMVVHRWRAEEDAILIGAWTAETDDPKLNVREWTGPSPLRVVLDPSKRLSGKLNLFSDGDPTFRVTGTGDLIRRTLDELYEKDILSLMVEGGPYTLERFIERNLWDEIRVIRSSKSLKKGLPAPIFKGRMIDRCSFGLDEILTYLRT
ncbi:MAG: bifunctional diaminohydroxyphosphoribosylaminopyrimidine deaminase/5-amino-6-(5-phosphoribosylamino)uracil reductase RibD [Bacteroidota bacterium]|nr:bifunctional diaminohydroxyphosphoribosylaminopyrimidine deaminase/5-amino-6-(5-phosphoribosylamino)uracil reductase RibD [Bacteroidota bacterium]MDX5448558.1 bifunctional diaminohydroxyphosphoribosylaminopyrimidine deaminase/5-amino-6-(5-phosphoribosylamino)uracil reductase RibD [Bacteroidota bacterium]MDX5504874.1 bifunctional diaminohydroxyphosphoribosylaminopyrimidine deaminase/5-amino-6-(5-phosphoribosylamino)uracil reductase RibD [Bacteroidota bacterium]